MSHIEGSPSQWQDSAPTSGPKTLVRATGVSIETIRIASPCTTSWNQMEGNEQVRFCGSCRKNVYNLSAMNRTE
ncbi:MAG: hypothetical protein M3Y56_14785, partial [Armatimonadota bacterium]|nr:hypothetical protein [Armatimonadota bacterium]